MDGWPAAADAGVAGGHIQTRIGRPSDERGHEEGQPFQPSVEDGPERAQRDDGAVRVDVEERASARRRGRRRGMAASPGAREPRATAATSTISARLNPKSVGALRNEVGEHRVEPLVVEVCGRACTRAAGGPARRARAAGRHRDQVHETEPAAQEEDEDRDRSRGRAAAREPDRGQVQDRRKSQPEQAAGSGPANAVSGAPSGTRLAARKSIMKG